MCTLSFNINLSSVRWASKDMHIPCTLLKAVTFVCTGLRCTILTPLKLLHHSSNSLMEIFRDFKIQLWFKNMAIIFHFEKINLWCTVVEFLYINWNVKTYFCLSYNQISCRKSCYKVWIILLEMNWCTLE